MRLAIRMASLLLLAASGIAAAQDPQTGDVPASPSAIVHKSTPVRLLPRKSQPSVENLYPDRGDREALVYVRFNLDATGRVSDVELADGGFHNENYVDAALNIVRRLKFSPATRDGVPVDSFGVRIPIRFTLNLSEGVTQEFRREANKVEKLIRDRDFAGAHFHAQWMLAEKVKLNYEFAALQATLAFTHSGVGNTHRALLASRQATSRSSMSIEEYEPGGPLPQITARDFVLPKELVVLLLKLRFRLAASQGFFLDALRAHAYLQALGEVPDDDPTRQAFDQMLHATLTAPALKAHAILDESGTWDHDLLFHAFTLDNVRNGPLRKVILSCAGYQRVLDYAPGLEWSIPSKWQNCSLVIDGTPGTDVDIIEFRKGVAASDDQPGQQL